MVDHTDVRDHPDVRAASAKVREAYIALGRTEVPAPVAGYVARRSVQLGQCVAHNQECIRSETKCRARWRPQVSRDFQPDSRRNDQS